MSASIPAMGEESKPCFGCPETLAGTPGPEYAFTQFGIL